jgi:hypothetical protein
MTFWIILNVILGAKSHKEAKEKVSWKSEIGYRISTSVTDFAADFNVANTGIFGHRFYDFGHRLCERLARVLGLMRGSATDLGGSDTDF